MFSLKGVENVYTKGQVIRRKYTIPYCQTDLRINSVMYVAVYVYVAALLWNSTGLDKCFSIHTLRIQTIKSPYKD